MEQVPLGIRLIQSLDELAERIHSNAKAKGFWEGDRNDGEMVALFHSEVSELLEALRHPAKGRQPSEHIPEITAAEEECADVFIRMLDTAKARGWRIGNAILRKMDYNDSREYKHGKRF